MNLRRWPLSLFALTALAPVAPAAGLMQNADAPSTLVRAHDSFLKRDFPAMVRSVKETLRDAGADDAVRANAAQLMTAGFRDACGQLPSDWRAPDGMRWLAFTETHVRSPGGDAYKLDLWFNVSAANAFSQVQVVRFPDEVVMDKRAGVGEYTVEPRPDGSFGVGIVAEFGRTPPPDGLYLLNFDSEDGVHTSGWLLLDNMVATQTPTLRAPAVGAHLQDGRVEFAWDDFRSPAYDPCERRTVRVSVGKNLTEAPYWVRMWSFKQEDPTLTKLTVGATPGDSLPNGLVEGDYWATLTYEEAHQFGDLSLVRASRVARPIVVGPNR